MDFRTETVHIAPVGFETERVYEPIRSQGADNIVLLRNRGELNGDGVDKAEECIATIQRELISGGISPDDILVDECDFFDVSSAILAFTEHIEKHSESDVYLNVATGSKLTAIAGVIACTATNATPYYVHAEGYMGDTITTGVKKTTEVTTYPLNLPHQQYLKVLIFVQENEPVIKRDIVEFAKDLPLLSEYTRKDERNWYKPVTDEIITPLVNQDYLVEQNRGNETRYSLSKAGGNALEILSYLV